MKIMPVNVLEAAAAILLTVVLNGCVELDVDLSLGQDGSITVDAGLLSAVYAVTETEYFKETVSGALLATNDWQITEQADARGWQGFRAKRTASALTEMCWGEGEKELCLADVLKLTHIDGNIYELRLDLPVDTTDGLSFEGEPAPAPIDKDTGQTDIPVPDLLVLLLRGVRLGATCSLPGDIIATSLPQTGPRAVGGQVDGNSTIREYYSQTDRVSAQQRGEVFESVVCNPPVPLTNVWVRFHWPEGRSTCRALARTRQDRPPVRHVLLPAPPLPRYVASDKLGRARITSAETTVARNRKQPEPKCRTTWQLAPQREKVLQRRLAVLQTIRARLDKLITVPHIETDSAKLSTSHWQSNDRSWFSMSATCSFEAGDIPARITELAGGLRVIMTDRPLHSWSLRPSGNGVYALQWRDNGKPWLDRVGRDPDNTIVYCHRNAKVYLRDKPDLPYHGESGWSGTQNRGRRWLKLQWYPGGKNQKPVLRLHRRMFVCDYEFSLQDVRVP